MMEVDRYVRAVLRHVPPPFPERERIAREVRAHLEESVEAGESERGAVRRMGPPEEVAAGFLAERPRKYAPLTQRIAAYIVDAGIVAVPVLWGVLWLAWRRPEVMRAIESETTSASRIFVLGMIAFSFGYTLLYFPLLEARRGQTIGKWLFGIAVVKTSGTSVGFWGAMLRRLPFLFDFQLLDALFAPFTAKRQRAFDMVAGTVVVRCPRSVSLRWAWICMGVLLALFIAAAVLLAAMTKDLRSADLPALSRPTARMHA